MSETGGKGKRGRKGQDHEAAEKARRWFAFALGRRAAQGSHDEPRPRKQEDGGKQRGEPPTKKGQEVLWGLDGRTGEKKKTKR